MLKIKLQPGVIYQAKQVKMHVEEKFDSIIELLACAFKTSDKAFNHPALLKLSLGAN